MVLACVNHTAVQMITNKSKVLITYGLDTTLVSLNLYNYSLKGNDQHDEDEKYVQFLLHNHGHWIIIHH